MSQDKSLAIRRRETLADRQKRWAPKVRTGCSTCRIRRVKCDETWPHCLRCTRSKRSCPGYVKSQETSIWAPHLLFQPAARVQPPQISANETESHLFHYFREEISLHMGGGLHKMYWRGYLLPNIGSQPAIWHACCAVSAIHRTYNNKTAVTTPIPSDNNLYIVGLSQYHQALRYMIQLTSKSDMTLEDQLTILATNLLFLTLSWFRGELSEATSHVYNGMSLISQWELWRLIGSNRQSLSESVLLPVESLLLMFIRSDSATMLSRDPAASKLDEIIIPPKIANGDYYSSMEAYFELEFLWNTTMKLLRQDKLLSPVAQSLDMKEQCRALRLSSQEWWKKAIKFEASQHCNQAHFDALSMMKMRYTFIEIMLRLDPTAGELSWDKFDSHFRRILEFGDAVAKQLDKTVGVSHLQDASPRRSTLITMTMNEPLLALAWRCRDPVLRHRAIEMIQHEERRYSKHDRTIMAHIAKVIVTAEEQAAANPENQGCGCIPGAFVCDSHRVVTLYLNRSSSAAEIVYRMKGDIDKDIPLRTVSLLSTGQREK